MDGFNAMIRAIYESPDFSVKGHTATVEDLFVVRHDAAVYIVAVVRLGRLDGTLMSYAYALYDVDAMPPSPPRSRHTVELRRCCRRRKRWIAQAAPWGSSTSAVWRRPNASWWRDC